ncbi:hypothetical protein SODALDRAFT_338862 [Sodiomyces alkalinus F11]|uniref:SWIRM domain-containing protein n=1 Tax=Sodiomyces alkalinus (strain CBS 110278 / VKM F-3762 / F11) TaxID=1314773 RepID=A0A3N2Q490_SODAK|nr:hypothetical protein SODALDRAFT_338862 [Sodiomyces alkalinus F11]ROT41594.1 hypothetical protein SODALDRAFT_338862 [Sodiomyces alkalinus F11]
MALSNQQNPASAGTSNLKQKALEISNLMSPPDPPPFENFNQTTDQDAKEPMSPPVSPDTGRDRITLETTGDNAVKDPILYPPEDSVSSPPQQPLFPSSESAEHRRIVDRHIASRNTALFGGASPPRREHYELTLQFKSQIMLLYTKNRRAWMEKERALLIKDREAIRDRWSNKRYPALAPAKSSKAPTRIHQPTKAVRNSGVTKPGRIVKPLSANRSPLPPHSSAKHVGSPPEPSRRTVAPNREDRDFRALPDYCPPISSLPNKTNSLKVDWKGAPVDLSSDPNAHLLHPDELSLAANLRLDCATYLTSKRRIFIRRLECARIGKEFRKTDAQQACKIDVNKASKLWTAFEKVGWLDLKWMKSFV